MSSYTRTTWVDGTDIFTPATPGDPAINAANLNNIEEGVLYASTVFNVKAFGATGDSTTDDSSAIQQAIDACDVNRGGTVYFPQGRYRIATGLTITNQGTWLVGEGSSGTGTGVALGSSRIVSDDGVTAITCNPTGTSHGTLGFGFRQLHVMAASGSTSGNGILVQNTEKTIVEHVTCSDYVAGYGLKLGSTSGNAQYADLHDFSAGDCLYGLHLGGSGTAPNGIRVFGGYFEGDGTTPRVNSVGIYIEAGDTVRVFGTVIQGYETGIYVTATAKGHEVYGPRFEYCNIGLRLGALARNFALVGGTFSNSLLVNTGAGNVGIQIDSGATDCMVMPTTIDGCVTDIVDNGTRTRMPRNTGVTAGAALLGTVVGKVAQYDSGDNLLGYLPIYDTISGITTPTLVQAKVTNTTSVASISLTVPAGGIAAGTFLWVAAGYGLGSTPASLDVTDSSSNTYTLAQQNDKTTNATPHTAVWTCKVATALDAGDTITFTPSTAVNYPVFYAYRSDGAATASWLDDHDGATGASSSPASPGLTTGVDYELIFGVVNYEGTATLTIDSGYTVLDTNSVTGKKVSTFYKIAGAAGTETPGGTLSGSVDWSLSAIGVKKA